MGTPSFILHYLPTFVNCLLWIDPTSINQLLPEALINADQVPQWRDTGLTGSHGRPFVLPILAFVCTIQGHGYQTLLPGPYKALSSACFQSAYKNLL